MSRLAVHEMSGSRRPRRPKKLLLYRERLRPQGRKTTDATTKLTDVEPLSSLVETLPVTPQLGEPACGLEAEGDRQTVLAMRSTGHGRVTVAAAQLGCRRRLLARGRRRAGRARRAGSA